MSMASPADLAAKQLSWELESWKSIELQIQESFENQTKPNPVSPEFSAYEKGIHYIETAAGQRMYEERTRPAGEREQVSIKYTDGKLAAELLRQEHNGVERDQITIQRAFGREGEGWANRPMPLKYLYVGLERLPKALPKAVNVGVDRHLNRPCDLFLFPRVGSGRGATDYVYWLDRATGIPLRVDYYPDEKARSESRPAAVWTAESLDEIDGRHLPLKSELVRYQPAEAGLQKISFRLKSHVVSVRFDRDYPKTTFWPEISRNAMVFDTINKKLTAPQAAATNAQAAVGMPPPIRSAEPRDWVSLGSTAALLAGAAVVTLGLVLRRRRK
jgi:hypothetical protein